VEQLIKAGGNFVLNISASPLMGRESASCAARCCNPNRRQVQGAVAMVNQVGGNDQLIFDGSSFVVGPDGSLVAQAKSFEEDMIFFDSNVLTGDVHGQVEGLEASVYAALVLETRDYVQKCGFQRVIIGLSGGIDSALTAAIAVDALGPENVIGVGMPSRTHRGAALMMPASWLQISVSASTWSASTPSLTPIVKA